MKRPLLFILIFLIFGILSYFINKEVIIALFLILFTFSFYLHKKYKLIFPLFLICFSFLGLTLTSYKNKQDIFQEKQNITATGYITNIEKTRSSTYKFTLNTKNITTSQKNYNKSLKFKVYVNDIQNLKNGDIVTINGKIYKPTKPKNPTDYNQFLAFKINNISYKLYPDNISIVGSNKIISTLSIFKQKLSSIYDSILPPNESNILKAMILGEKQYLDEQTIVLYKNAGIYHILAISGLHIGILAMFLTKLFGLISKKYGNFFVMLILIMYCIFTGGSISTTRATIMSLVVLFAYIIYKDPDFISSICFSAIILLIKNPYNLFDVGFLYSYVCVFSIAFLGGRICALYNLNFLAKSLITSFFVSIAIKPISAYYFYNINILDFLLNIIVLPFMSIIVVLGFLTIPVYIISIPLAKILVLVIYFILKYFYIVCRIFDNISFNNVFIGKPSFIIIFGFYAMLIFISYALYEKHLLNKRKKYINIGLLIFLTSILLTFVTNLTFSVTMLNTDKGECIIGENKKATFLIDGGNSSLGSTYSFGENTILPFLKSKGIDEIDFAFITHNDINHIQVFLDIIDKVKINNIFIPCVFKLNDTYKTIISKAQELNIPIYILKKGDKLKLNDISFYVLSPTKDADIPSDDEASLVLKVIYKDKSILFTSDANSSLIEDVDNCDILKVSNSGFDGYTSKAFLEKTLPEICLISSDKDIPNEQTLNLLNDMEIKTYTTDENGAITINFYNNSKIKIFKSK